MSKLKDLFISFFKIGLFTFGGGYAMLPMLKKELVEEKQWVTEEEILDYFAIGQITPGVIAVNTATFIGYKKRGVIGGIVATLGVVCPSIIIILCIAAFLNSFSDIKWVQHAFAGISIAVLALIVKALWAMIQKGIKGWFTALIFAMTVAAMICGLSSVIVVLVAAAAGIIYKAVTKK